MLKHSTSEKIHCDSRRVREHTQDCVCVYVSVCVHVCARVFPSTSIKVVFFLLWPGYQLVIRLLQTGIE